MGLFENNSKLILDNISTNIYLVDQHYQIMDCNDAFADYRQQSRENIIGKPCYKVTHNSDIPCWEMKDTTCSAAHTFKKNEKCSAIHKHFYDGNVVIEEVISTPIFNGKYVLVEFRNLSDLLGLVQGILLVCAGCKKIRDQQGNWYQIEDYFHDKTGADFSHSLCPECKKRFYPHFIGRDKKK
ncbi:MAG: PAS domain-containing protein [Deltaproteobacteria bacterium]|nr:PAS domain-containing protein [Deltaproteobacteria bacterium]